MTPPTGKTLPSLSPEVSAAISALRQERPSAHLEYRLHTALVAAETAPAAPPQRWWGRGGRLQTGLYQPSARTLLGAVLASALIILVMRTDGVNGELDVQRETLPPRHVSFQLPEAGAGWLELPWTHGLHSGETATVRFDAPAELDFHRHAERLPSLQLLSCDAGRCIHEFTADTGAGATPLRVRIDKPGRYEFRLSHASDSRLVQEHFVVEAAL